MKNYDARLTKQHLSTKIFNTYFRYLKIYYPEISVEEICADLGLGYEYFLDESNWVSIEFDEKFLTRIKNVINDPNFEFEVGKFSISKEGLGPALYAVGRNALSLKNIYNNSWKLSKYWNRALKFELVEHSDGIVKLKIAPDYAILENNELEILKKILPDMVANTVGYYASAPLLKGYPSASIEIEKISETEYILQATYPKEKSLLKKILFGFLTISVSHLLLILVGLSVFSTVISGYSLFVFLLFYIFFTENIKVKSLADETQKALTKVDEQYKSLVETKIDLQQKLREAEAVSKITQHLTQTTSEENILNRAAEDLTTILEFDRTVILIADSEEKFLAYKGGYVGDPSLLDQIKQIKFNIDIPSSDPTKISNVYKTGRSILIENVREHLKNLNTESQQILGASNSKSFVCVPVKSENKSFGVLLADTYKSERKLTKEDSVLLEVIGKQIAIALEKQRAQTEAVDAYLELNTLAKSYSRFVPWETIKLLGYESVTDVNIHTGKELSMAIIFCDIRNFTTMSEKMSPSESIAFLNSYFSNLAPIFQNNGGIIDKFLGDGIMALFTNVDSALIAMKEFQQRLASYNIQNRSGGNRAFIRAGMGLHYGKVLFGAVGFKERLSISVVSDSVNLASRLDGLTKKFKVECVCTDDVLAQMKNNHATRLIARLRVQGRDSMTNVFEVYSHLDGEMISIREKYKVLLEKLVNHFTEGDYMKCKSILSDLSSYRFTDSVVNYYAEEIEKVLNKINLAS